MRAFALVLACAACQGQPAPGPVPGSGGASGAPPDARAASDAGAGGAAIGGSDARGKSVEPETADPGRVIAELGAIPAWQAVIDRAQLLGRRGQHGVVYGRVGPPVMVPAPVPVPPPAGTGAMPGSGSGAGSGSAAAGSGSAAAGSGSAAAGSGSAGAGSGSAAAGSGSAAAGSGSAARTGSGAVAGAGTGGAVRAGSAATGVAAGTVSPAPGPLAAPGLVKSAYVWLIDDTEGNGCLGIRILLGDKASEGDRIAAGGAWQLDTDRRWYWKPDAIQPLPPAPPGDLKEPPPPAPSHAIATGELPPGARTVGVARDNDAIYFQIVGPSPISEGDGWQVADQLGSPTALVLNLPGERPSYGGQDLRSSDERWQLRRAQTYWVRIGRLHNRGDKPAMANARTAPIRVP
ncbi:MAG: hypothetical protein E6J90_20405 [Deltaproteobacteria bacterium]|nr:MAG: hypothetical protein E6J90_20405 [Deltaproteobacteria bacterium]